MKKLFAVLAMAVITSSAFSQVTVPVGGKRKLPDVPNIADFRQEFNFEILQVQQCVEPTADVASLLNDPKDPGGTVNDVLPLPSGLTPNNWCLRGNNAGGLIPDLAFPACRFVGGVLCLDPGPNSDFASLATGCPTFEGQPTDVVIQGIKLRKVEPRFPKCPDIYPGIDFTQTGVSGIRTFWALKYTPCNTVFTLDLEYGCVSRTFPRRIVQVRTNRYNFKVVARPETLRWVLEALHCQPLGTCEVPCITDEGLFARLLLQSDTIAEKATAAKLGGSASILALNDALDTMEATVVRYAFFTQATWAFSEKTGALMPCAIFERLDSSPTTNTGTIGGGAATVPGFIPGNKTIDQFGFGIVDTFEHPCVCKLLSDIVCIKADLIGTDP
jgi:hypothetical protein